MLGLLKRIHGEGAAVLLVTTRDDVARELGGRKIVLDEGRLTGDLVPRAGAPFVGGGTPGFAPTQAPDLPGATTFPPPSPTGTAE